MQPQRTASAALSPVLEAQHARAIVASHERSRAFGLRADERPDLSLLSRAELELARQRNHRLCEQATPVMELLWEQVSHTQSMVVLTDGQGTVLHALGHTGFLERAHRVALAPGAVWCEASKGTNAVGTALMEEQPTLVHAREHYLSSNHFLTCSAAPIFDHAGRVLGVIDVSGDHRSYHPHTLALACMSARLIENQWFSDRFRGVLKLHLHASPSGIGTVQEGVIALDADGRILGANRGALDLLGHSAARLRHERLDALFGVSLAQLIDHARLSTQAPMLLVHEAAEGGGRCADVPALPAVWAGEPGEPSRRQSTPVVVGNRRVLHARLSGDAIGPGPIAIHPVPAATAVTSLQRLSVSTPQAESPPAGAAPVMTLRERELEAMRQAVEAAGGNMAQAARALGIGRSTLYRKLRK
jgi:transcriptional regulator of acetoin/glycerol metabolism